MRKGRDGRWHVYNKETGADKGGSRNKSVALAHMRALYAAEDHRVELNKKRG
jgi:hypothetical protein